MHRPAKTTGRGAVLLPLLFACLKGVAAYLLTALAVSLFLCRSSGGASYELPALLAAGVSAFVLGASVARVFRLQRYFAACLSSLVLLLLLFLIRLPMGEAFTGWTAGKALVIFFGSITGASLVRLDPRKRRRRIAR